MLSLEYEVQIIDSDMYGFVFSCPTALQAGGHLHLGCVCVSESVSDNFEPCDWSTQLPEFKTGSAVQTGIQQSV